MLTPWIANSWLNPFPFLFICGCGPHCFIKIHSIIKLTCSVVGWCIGKQIYILFSQNGNKDIRCVTIIKSHVRSSVFIIFHHFFINIYFVIDKWDMEICASKRDCGSLILSLGFWMVDMETWPSLKITRGKLTSWLDITIIVCKNHDWLRLSFVLGIRIQGEEVPSLFARIVIH